MFHNPSHELRLALLPAAPPPPAPVDLRRTFARMQCRKLRRRLLAVHTELSQGEATAWIAAYVAPMLILWGLGRVLRSEAGDVVHWHGAEAILAGACAVAAYAAVARSATCVDRCCMWWAYVLTVVALAAHVR